MNPLLHRIPPVLLAALLLCAACTTTPAPPATGRWAPVNRLGDAPQAIPLRAAQAYYATPVDGTLKALLERWARDSHMGLDYGCDVDFTLYRPVADVRSDDLHAALSQLASLYASERLVITVDGSRIVVRRNAAANPGS